MCQGVIFVWNKSKNSYHWGIGSHSNLIRRTFNSDSPNLYDRLVRVEALLRSGPGQFSIEGGFADEDQQALFKDKLISMAGSPQKLVAFAEKYTNAGFDFDYAFLNILNEAGQTEYHKLRDTDNLDLSAKHRNTLDEVEILEGEDWSEPDVYDLRLSIAAYVLKITKSVMTGKALESAIRKHAKTVLQAQKERAIKDALAELKQVDVDSYLEDNFRDCLRNLADDVEFDLGTTLTQYADEMYDDPFSTLDGKQTVQANKLYRAEIEKLRKTLPKEAVPMSEVAAFKQVALDRDYLTSAWLKAFDEYEKAEKSRPATKTAAKKTKKKSKK